MNPGQIWGSGGTVLSGLLILVVGAGICSLDEVETFAESIRDHASAFGIAVLGAVQSAKMYIQSRGK